MKKIFFFLVVVLVVFLLIFETKIAQAGVTLHFDFQEGRVSEAYVKFTYEFGSQFGLRIQRYHFRGKYKVQILEGEGKIRYQDKMEEELVIVALINEEKIPFVWIKVKDLSTGEKIKKKGKEFSDKIFERLKELERRKKLRQVKHLGLLGLFPRALFDLRGLDKILEKDKLLDSSYYLAFRGISDLPILRMIEGEVGEKGRRPPKKGEASLAPKGRGLLK